MESPNMESWKIICPVPEGGDVQLPANIYSKHCLIISCWAFDELIEGIFIREIPKMLMRNIAANFFTIQLHAGLQGI